MEATKTETFTPGPWRAIGGDSVYTDDSPTGAYDRSLADLSTGPLSASEKAANARLMAAAPEMYEALRDATTMLDALGYKAGGDIRDACDAALAKAVGNA